MVRVPYRPSPAPAPADGSPAGVVELDHRVLTVTSDDDPLVVVFPQVDAGTFWLIERITVSTTSSDPTSCAVYDDEPDQPGALISQTTSGNNDYDDAASPYLIDSGQQLRVVWTGASPEAIATCRLQYRLMAHGGRS